MKSKKLLSIILALAMMFSVLPASTVLVYADEITETISADTTWNDGDTVGGVTISGGTVTINGDVGITAAITIKGDVTFTGGGTLNRMSTSGNLIKVESGSLTLDNVTIDGNNVIISDSGAAAAINMAGGTVIMNDGTKITNHKRTSGYGPAVYMTGGNFKMKGGTISGCESRNYGGAIYLDGGSFEMNGGIIENNKTTLSSAGYGGGAFYVREATLIINDGLIQNNSSNSGGAIYNTSFGTTIINGGVIKGNTAVGDSPSGSAIFHSCKTTGEATLQIGGNANINVGNDIYLMSNTSATKYVEITSSIKNPLILAIEGESEGRVIADAADGVVLTYNDMAKIRLSNSSYALKLENNQIKLTQTSSGETKFPVYLGYDANNGTNAPNGSSAEIVAGNSATFTISDSVPTRTGYDFLGWATNKDATSAEYSSGGSITISSNTTLYAVWKKISTFETNEFTQPLAITGWTYGETANTPTAVAKYGTIKYTYSNTADGTYTEEVPTNAGTYYVKATVEETEGYSGLESNAVEFTILPKKIDTAITQLTAPVKNEVPQTEIETDEYTATVVWSPEVTDKFVYNTVYTATITITPKTNYTVKGIAENGYTVSGAETVTNEADSATVTVVYSATENKNSNEFTQPLAITGWTYGEKANTPTAVAKYGTIKYTYSNTADGTYTEEVPTNAGTYYVKATVEETADYSGLESNAVEFTILPKTINTAITQLTAPVKNEVPQTEIETDEYTATVVWSPEVTDKFGYSTVYTATITITPKANYTVKGIAENGYTVSGAQTVTNEADSATVTVVYSATENKNSNEFTQPLAITGWTYGETANTPTAVAKYGTIKYTYSNTADGTYTEEVPTNAGTYYVKATVEETADYSGLESNAVEFTILPKTINTAITQLTAPVKNEVPQTEIETDEYIATVVWSPEVEDKFGYDTIYTATITITPKANYTVKGIAENGYTVSGAQTVTNEADSATVTAVYSATGSYDTVDTNEFTKPLEIVGWTYGDTPNAPTATAKYGTIKYTYSTAADGEYSEIVPTDAGIYYVKAKVEETDKYTGLESDAVEFVIGKKILTNDNITKIADQTYTGEEIKPVIEVKDGDKILVLDTDYTVAYEKNINASEGAKVKVEIISNNYEGTLEKLFTILPKTINSAIILTAPVKNGVPQTEIETDEYTATVAWSPEVTDKFGYSTVYTATITITPKANYTVKGIAENGYTVSGAQTVTNEADSATITAVYAATGSKSSGGSGRTKRYTVSFNTNGGNKITSQTVAKDNSVKEPTAPIKENFEFAGWYTDKELTTKYDFTEKVTKSFTLYAKWTEQKQENGGSEDVINNNSGNENKESSNTIVLTIDEHDALVYGTTKTNDVAPKVVNDRTMLPARFVAENLGATVEWDGEKQLVTITGKTEKQEDVIILITIGSDYAKVNGEDVKLDSPAFVENDRTYTPIRFISENLGATVEWNETEQTVTIQRVK